MQSERERARLTHLRAVVASHHEVKPQLRNPGDSVLVERGCLRSLVIRCPCGCGADIVVNLDRRAGAAWRLFRRSSALTLYPSVWREGGCQSHFIVWNDRILWMDGKDEYWEREGTLDERVIPLLKDQQRANVVQLADALDEIPWAVHASCRRLVEAGYAREGQGDANGWFEWI